MINILLRIMRKIINEELKLKSKVHQPITTDSGATLLEEYFQGSQVDLYKETIAFYINALLKKKT